MHFVRSKLLSSLVIAIFAATTNAQPGFRAVTISTQPGATVWVDGVRFGTADKNGALEIKTVASGAHTLRVRADGFKEKTQPLTAAQRGEVKVALVQTTDEAELAFQEGERQSTQDRQKAAAAYRRAAKLRANYPEAYLALARTLADAGEPAEAEKAANQARRLRPGYAEASAVLGRLYKDNGEEAKAVAAFKRAITEGRGFQPEAYAGLGLLYKEKAEGFGSSGDYDAEAEAYAESAKNLRLSLKQLSGAPDAIVIYQLLGLIYEKQKKTAEAIATYEEFLRIFPDAVEATAVQSFITQLKKDQQQ
jgi:tetratricopeptide (TPR) repeat protein